MNFEKVWLGFSGAVLEGRWVKGDAQKEAAAVA